MSENMQRIRHRIQMQDAVMGIENDASGDGKEEGNRNCKRQNIWIWVYQCRKNICLTCACVSLSKSVKVFVWIHACVCMYVYVCVLAKILLFLGIKTT